MVTGFEIANDQNDDRLFQDDDISVEDLAALNLSPR